MISLKDDQILFSIAFFILFSDSSDYFLISLSFSNEGKQEEKSLQWRQLLLNTDLYGPEKRIVESDCTVRTGLKARDRHSCPVYSRWENWFFLGFVSAMIQDFACPVSYSHIVLAGTAFRGWSRFTRSMFSLH